MIRTLQIAACCGLTILCLGAAWWSLRAAAGQFDYFQAKFGNSRIMKLDAARPKAETIRRRLDLVQRSIRRYPPNYRACRAGADIAFEAIWDLRDIPHDATIEELRTWCDRGLALNPYSRRLNYIDAEIIARTSPARALKKWSTYMEWNFWDPFNHYYVVELLARSGRFSDAFRHLKWLKGQKHEDDARMIIRYEWKEQERQMHEYLQQRSRR